MLLHPKGRSQNNPPKKGDIAVDIESNMEFRDIAPLRSFPVVRIRNVGDESGIIIAKNEQDITLNNMAIQNGPNGIMHMAIMMGMLHINR